MRNEVIRNIMIKEWQQNKKMRRRDDLACENNERTKDVR